MTPSPYAHLYSRTIAAAPDRIHFAAHSHHPWPDQTREAMLQYWDDSARGSDHKWETIFGEVVPRLQKKIAQWTGFTQPQQIAFGGNTHELVTRVLSSLPPQARILTTDSEFHSFYRQAHRLEEDGWTVQKIPTEPFSTFPERFLEARDQAQWDLLYFSHVFFNSGWVVPDLSQLIDPNTPTIVDGYHSFMALPLNLQPIENHCFFVAGGYKYAQAGEGVCWMSVPANCTLRPQNTGWFAHFDGLAEPRDDRKTGYSNDGFRFWGSTYDPSGQYRQLAALDALESAGLNSKKIHHYVRQLQTAFLDKLSHLPSAALSVEQLLLPIDKIGHFLCFEHPQADQLVLALKKRKIIVDNRGTRLRIGFGVYQDESQIDLLLEALATTRLS